MAARRRDRLLYAAIAAVLLVALGAVLLAPSSDESGSASSPALERPPSGVPGVAARPAGDRRVAARLRAHDRDGAGVVTGDVKERLARLRGVPVVINQWASWCPPCAAEFPFFQRLSRRYGDRVAFLGLDAGDERPNARRFLEAFPVTYPSIFDPEAEQSRSVGAGRSWPSTVFVDRTGRRTFVRQGAYATQAQLEAELRRYALGAPR